MSVIGKAATGIVVLTAVVIMGSLFYESPEDAEKNREGELRKEFSLQTPEIQKYWTKHGPPPAMDQEIYAPGRLIGNRAVKTVLMQSVKDPESLVIEWMDAPSRKPDGWVIRCGYRAKNSFGGYVRETKLFVFNAGVITSVR